MLDVCLIGVDFHTMFECPTDTDELGADLAELDRVYRIDLICRAYLDKQKYEYW